MNPHVKQQWIRALDSTRYKIGRPNALRDADNCYDLLGVLCDIHAVQTGHDWNLMETLGCYSYMDCTYWLPEAVRLWAGLTRDEEDEVLGWSNLSRQAGVIYIRGNL